MISAAEPRVSVVTPVYNGEPYLATCIESVLQQTYRHFDYTIVDNCSTDHSAEIAARFASADSRIRVLRNPEFLSQRDNVNGSLHHISPAARYVKLVFADDAILPTCLEQMVAVAESDPAIGVVSAYETHERGINCQGLPFGSTVIEGRDALRMYLLQGDLLVGSPTTVLLRADLVRRRGDLLAADDEFFEDIQAFFEMLAETRLGFVHQVLTFSRRANVSTISRVTPFNPFQFMRLLMLHRFGRRVLSDAEYAQVARRLESEYWDFLGEAVLRRREPEFWEFHRLGLSKMGRRLHTPALACGTVRAGLDLLLNPKSTVERLWRRWRHASSTVGSACS